MVEVAGIEPASETIKHIHFIYTLSVLEPLCLWQVQETASCISAAGLSLHVSPSFQACRPAAVVRSFSRCLLRLLRRPWPRPKTRRHHRSYPGRYCRQLVFDRLFTRPTDQPRHVAYMHNLPSKPLYPLNWFVVFPAGCALSQLAPSCNGAVVNGRILASLTQIGTLVLLFPTTAGFAAR